MEEKETPHYRGHRARLRERFLRGGADSLNDYEILELILFTAIPRRDVKPLAKQLIAHFGSLPAVFTADAEALMSVEGIKEVAATAIKIAATAAHRLAREQVLNRPVLSSWDKLLDYCRISLAHLPTEHFHLLFLDTKSVLIADETQAVGTVNHTAVYPREVVKRALELNASSIIMVHNHPTKPRSITNDHDRKPTIPGVFGLA